MTAESPSPLLGDEDSALFQTAGSDSYVVPDWTDWDWEPTEILWLRGEPK